MYGYYNEKLCVNHYLVFVSLQSKLPQLSALHHNNCMYIAHHLLTLGHQFRSKLPEPLNQSVATFVDLVPTIRHMGEKCFLEQLVSISFEILFPLLPHSVLYTFLKVLKRRICLTIKYFFT